MLILVKVGKSVVSTSSLVACTLFVGFKSCWTRKGCMSLVLLNRSRMGLEGDSPAI